MSGEHLATMVNDIANFFASEPDRQLAIEGVAGHMKRFWEPRMRRQIVELREHGEATLSELANVAIDRLREMDAAKKPQ